MRISKALRRSRKWRGGIMKKRRLSLHPQRHRRCAGSVVMGVVKGIEGSRSGSNYAGGGCTRRRCGSVGADRRGACAVSSATTSRPWICRKRWQEKGRLKNLLRRLRHDDAQRLLLRCRQRRTLQPPQTSPADLGRCREVSGRRRRRAPSSAPQKCSRRRRGVGGTRGEKRIAH